MDNPPQAHGCSSGRLTVYLSAAGRQTPRSQGAPNRVQTIAMVSMAASTPGSPKSASGTPVEAPAGSR